MSGPIRNCLIWTRKEVRETLPECPRIISAKQGNAGEIRYIGGMQWQQNRLPLVDRPRVRAMLNMVDIIRLDHFRGFRKILGDSRRSPKLQFNGHWVEGPRGPAVRGFVQSVGQDCHS